MTDPVEIKEPLHCLSCDAEITMVSDLQNSRPFHRGQIVICGECAAIHKVGDSDLVKFTKEDFNGLDAQSKNIIAMTVTSILHNRATKGN